MKTEAKDCDVGNATTLGERFSPETAAALKEHEIELISLGRRLRHVLSVHAELNRVTRGRSFLIRHEAMWWMLLGERDMIVVDAASWAKAFYSRGGFLRKLQGPDFRALKRRWDYRTAEEDFEPLWSGRRGRSRDAPLHVERPEGAQRSVARRGLRSTVPGRGG